MEPSTTVVNERYEVDIDRAVQTPLTEDHRAHDLMLDRPVVFKTLADELVSDRGFVERFRRHVQAAANLTHPNITAVYDWGRDRVGLGERPGPTYYVITERVSGRTVAGYVQTNGALPVPRAIHVMLGVTAALTYAHRNGTLHGGLRPEAVSVTPNGLAKVSDFGFERSLGVDWSPEEDRPDDAAWRAPELVRSEEPDERTDVYGAGLLLYLLVTGRAPFTGLTASDLARKHLESIPEAPSKANADIPRTLEVIIGRSMAKRREDRFASVADLRAALVRFRGAQAPTDPSSATPAISAPIGATPAIGAAAGAAVGGAALLAPGVPGEIATPVTTADKVVDDDVTQWAPPPPPDGEPGGDPDAAGKRAAVAAAIFPTPQRPPTFADEALPPAAADDDATIVLAPASGADPGSGSGLSDQPDVTTVNTERETTTTTGGRGDRSPRIWPLALVLAVLIGVLGGLGWLLVNSLNLTSSGGRSVTVPSVLNQTSAQAETTLTNAGLTVTIESVSNPTVAADIVFDQSPPAGETVTEGDPVSLKVSAGSGVPRVPDVVGQTETAARAVLATVGLPIDREERFDDSAPPGDVIEQIPKADTIIDATVVRVKLIVSKSTGKVAVPDVAAMTQEQATKAMIDAGFRFVIQGEPSATVDKTKATRTEPPAGTQLDKGAPVTVFVSKGPAVGVPSVFGQTEANALATLTGSGFSVDRRTRPVRDSADVGVVVDQTPQAGTEAAPGATVSVVIGVVDPSTPSTRAPRATTTVPSSVVGESSAASTAVPVTEAPTTPPPATPAPTAPTTPPATAAPAAPVAVAPVPVASTVP